MIESAEDFKSEGQILLDGRTYGTRLLGGNAVGSTSFIHLAYEWDSAANRARGAPLILKLFLPKEGASFLAESALLRGVAEYDGTGPRQHFPHLIADSHAQYFSGQLYSVALMQYAGDEPVDSRIPIEEPEALLLIRHYLEAVIAVTRAGFTCWDRKLKDFYWTSPSAVEPEGRLLVVDWNMAESWSPALMVDDLIMAGRLLYELLTGSVALKRPDSLFFDLEQESDADGSRRARRPWKRISYGAQQIVETLLHGGHSLLVSLDASEEKKDPKAELRQHVEGLIAECSRIRDLWTLAVTPLRRAASDHLAGGRNQRALECTSILALKQIPDLEVGWKDAVPALSGAQGKGEHESALRAMKSRSDPLASALVSLTTNKEDEVTGKLHTLLAGAEYLSMEEELQVARLLAALTTAK